MPFHASRPASRARRRAPRRRTLRRIPASGRGRRPGRRSPSAFGRRRPHGSRAIRRRYAAAATAAHLHPTPSAGADRRTVRTPTVSWSASADRLPVAADGLAIRDDRWWASAARTRTRSPSVLASSCRWDSRASPCQVRRSRQGCGSAGPPAPGTPRAASVSWPAWSRRVARKEPVAVE